MAKGLSYQPLPNFGVHGLNTQYNPSTLDPSWLTTAENIVLRESGRISFRKGLKQKVVPSGTAIGSMVEHNDEGTNKIFASHGTSIYTIDFTSPNAAFQTDTIDVQHTVSGSSGDWQFVNFNNRLHCFHSGVVPQRYDGASDALERWSAHVNTTAINLADGGAEDAPDIVSGSTYKIASLGNTNFNLIGGDSTPAVDEIFTATGAGSSAVGSTITAPNIVSGKSYKIIALGNTDFELLGGDSDPAVGEVFTATSNGEDGIAGSAITAPNIVEGKRYKIITTGDTDFTDVGAADSDPNTIFTADEEGSTVAGTTGTVKEVTIGTTGTIAEAISGTNGTVTEIKTNPSLTTITVDSTVNFPPNGKIIIDDEIISYTGITSTTFTGCTRGADSTTATYHDDNDAVTTATKPASVTTFDPSCGMGYYGKLWCGGVTEAPDVVFYSVLLDGDDWTGTGSGYIDLKTVWGTDEIVAIAPFFGKLVIFGKNNIVVYDEPYSGGTLALNEVIKGIGCVSRDSVQAIADDLVFLSETGLRSLARTTEKDKLPMQEFSLAIKDTLIRNIGQSTNVKSVYVENEGIYIMSFVDKNISYVFDFKHRTPYTTPRVTTWIFSNDREPASMAYTELYGLLVGQQDGSLAGYEGYYDIDLAWVDGAASYTNSSFSSDISSAWINLGQSVSSTILKRMILVLEGGSGATMGLKWYKDFDATASDTTNINLRPATSGSTAKWGDSTSLYGTTTVTNTDAGSFVVGTHYAIATVGTTDFTLIGSSELTAGNFVVGTEYRILTTGTTDFTEVGADDSDVGTIFQATGVGSGTGTVLLSVFKATGAGSGDGTAVSHTHDSAAHSASSYYTPVYGLREYRTPLTGSAKHIKINLAVASNGYDAMIQNLTLLHKEGKIR